MIYSSPSITTDCVQTQGSQAQGSQAHGSQANGSQARGRRQATSKQASRVHESEVIYGSIDLRFYGSDRLYIHDLLVPAKSAQGRTLLFGRVFGGDGSLSRTL